MLARFAQESRDHLRAVTALSRAERGLQAPEELAAELAEELGGMGLAGARLAEQARAVGAAAAALEGRVARRPDGSSGASDEDEDNSGTISDFEMAGLTEMTDMAEMATDAGPHSLLEQPLSPPGRSSESVAASAELAGLQSRCDLLSQSQVKLAGALQDVHTLLARLRMDLND